MPLSNLQEVIIHLVPKLCCWFASNENPRWARLQAQPVISQDWRFRKLGNAGGGSTDPAARLVRGGTPVTPRAPCIPLIRRGNKDRARWRWSKLGLRARAGLYPCKASTTSLPSSRVHVWGQWEPVNGRALTRLTSVQASISSVKPHVRSHFYIMYNARAPGRSVKLRFMTPMLVQTTESSWKITR